MPYPNIYTKVYGTLCHFAYKFACSPTVYRDVIPFTNATRVTRASHQKVGRRLPWPMNTRKLGRVASALPASRVRIEYPIEGVIAHLESSFTERKATA
ncbi:hypothetical protein EVAR_43873_1 [Eumeta japonica]|uniref:Uncharacterized protein n=1 Tax=Eumeta variegata TaxID=151549 RepID=A0A4C1WQ78_EUMVA|nr:hypothetical protein EVAR_43873_1 [Eumeta japonica]